MSRRRVVTVVTRTVRDGITSLSLQVPHCVVNAGTKLYGSSHSSYGKSWICGGSSVVVWLIGSGTVVVVVVYYFFLIDIIVGDLHTAPP